MNGVPGRSLTRAQAMAVSALVLILSSTGCFSARAGDVPIAVDDFASLTPGDTVTISTRRDYDAKALHRLLFGDLNRDLWGLEYPATVLDLDSVGGGLTVEKLGGGQQTRSLHFIGADGLDYQFRSIEKDVRRGLPPGMEETLAADFLQDQLASQHPLAAMVVAEILRAADVTVAAPSPVVMPRDPRLGELMDDVAGRVGWIEIRPNEREGGRPGFEGFDRITGTERLLEHLEEDPTHRADQRQFLRARLVDFLVGDWDRHGDQWRWSRVERDGEVYWRPIPRDRDFAFVRYDGLVPSVTSWYWWPQQGFGPKLPDANQLSWHARDLDRRILQELSREEMIAEARALVTALDDRALRDAIAVLPRTYREADGDRMFEALRSRRDQLVRKAGEFYDYLARTVDLRGTESGDSVHVRSPDGRTVEISIVRGIDEDASSLRRHAFSADRTDEVRIHLDDGDDVVVVQGPRPLPITVRVDGEDGDDRYLDETSGARLHVVDTEDIGELRLGPRASVDTSPWNPPVEEGRRAGLVWSWRDWGSVLLPVFAAEYDSDIGAFVGGGLDYRKFGFRRAPYERRITLSVLAGTRLDEMNARFGFEQAIGRWTRLALRSSVQSARSIRYFGVGDDPRIASTDEPFESDRTLVRSSFEVERTYHPTVDLALAAEFDYRGNAFEGGTVFDSGLYGADEFVQFALAGSVDLRTREREILPTGGVHATIRGRWSPEHLDVEETYGRIEGSVSTVFSAGASSDLGLHLRAAGSTTFGEPPFFDEASLGGRSGLLGFAEQRFNAESAALFGALGRVRMGRVDVILPLHVGLHGFAETGRTWGEGGLDEWPFSYGGGLWIAPIEPRNAVSISVAGGDDGVRGYLLLGLPF